MPEPLEPIEPTDLEAEVTPESAPEAAPAVEDPQSEVAPIAAADPDAPAADQTPIGPIQPGDQLSGGLTVIGFRPATRPEDEGMWVEAVDVAGETFVLSLAQAEKRKALGV